MLIQMRAIQRAYRKGAVTIQALQPGDLSIAEGEFVAIMGPSGSGKSTLLHLIGCLDRPSSGSYLLDGIAVAELEDAQLSRIRNEKIGFVFQAFNLLPQHSVLQNIEAPLLYSSTFRQPLRQAQDNANSGSSTSLSDHQARALAEQVGLGQRLHHRPSELSGGEMQRVALARALVTQPRVILADEPTGNLDSQTGQSIMRMLQDLHEQGHTVIVVTHERSIADYAERILFLKDGRIEQEEHKENFSPPLPESDLASLPCLTETDFDKPESPETNSSPFDKLRERAARVPPSEPKREQGWGSSSRLTRKLSLTFPPFYQHTMSIVRTAIQGLLLHKLRSFLSVLGIVFGIGAFIAMLAIGAGARQEILEQIALLGTNTIQVKAITPAEEQVNRGREQLSEGLTTEDVARIFKISPSIRHLAALREFSFPVQYQQQVAQGRILATTSEYQHTANLPLARGRFLTETDEQEMQRVCVLGAEIQKALFAFQSPIGKMIKIQNDWFRVIGTLANKTFDQKNISAIRIRNINTYIYIPLSTSALFIAAEERGQIQEISIQVASADHVDDVARLVRTVLDRVHHGAQDYEVVVPRELLKQSQQTQSVFNVVMGSIAGISLLVGGIGIMNIMLATVTERTREIGIRRAIGASRRKILLQFLIETLVLTLIGGCLGIVLGAGGATLISLFAGWRTSISLHTVLLAVGISALVGFVFGMYPAAQGANMDPIGALRYE